MNGKITTLEPKAAKKPFNEQKQPHDHPKRPRKGMKGKITTLEPKAAKRPFNEQKHGLFALRIPFGRFELRSNQLPQSCLLILVCSKSRLLTNGLLSGLELLLVFRCATSACLLEVNEKPLSEASSVWGGVFGFSGSFFSWPSCRPPVGTASASSSSSFVFSYFSSGWSSPSASPVFLLLFLFWP